jgi:quercetin dioxygenase-like cupin family protein
MEILRWAEAAPPEEAALRAQMQAEGLAPSRWSNGPGDVYAVHSHRYTKVLACVQGSICFTLPDSGASIDLAPGDTMILPAGTRHGALVGPVGVVCIEAPRYEQ